MEKIVLVGGGGHCLSCIDVVEQQGKYEIAGILERLNVQDDFIGGYPVIGTDDDITELINNGNSFLITVGQIKSSIIRESIYNKIKDAGGELPVIVSPRAYVSRTAELMQGTIIMHDAIINANASIGICNIINTKALIEHEVQSGEFCHVSTGAILNGQVVIGNNNFIGSNSVIANNISISNDVIIASGSSVYKNIDTAGIYFGSRK